MAVGPETLQLSAGEEIEELWHEYEQGQTPAAQLVKDFDKVLRLPSCAHHWSSMVPRRDPTLGSLVAR